jgi:hypothetical protein
MPRTIRRRKYKQVSLAQIETGIFGEREGTADIDPFEIALKGDYGSTISFALATALTCPEGGYVSSRVPAATATPVSKDREQSSTSNLYSS